MSDNEAAQRLNNSRATLFKTIFPTMPHDIMHDMAMDFRTKEAHVAQYLREGILSGRMPRGMRLKQADIAEQLHLSITPVREA